MSSTLSPALEIDDTATGHLDYRGEQSENTHLGRVLSLLQVLIGEVESGTVDADGSACWIELDAALRSLHATSSSLSEAAAECQLPETTSPVTPT